MSKPRLQYTLELSFNFSNVPSFTKIANSATDPTHGAPIVGIEYGLVDQNGDPAWLSRLTTEMDVRFRIFDLTPDAIPGSHSLSQLSFLTTDPNSGDPFLGEPTFVEPFGGNFNGIAQGDPGTTDKTKNSKVWPGGGLPCWTFDEEDGTGFPLVDRGCFELSCLVLVTEVATGAQNWFGVDPEMWVEGGT